MGACVTDEELRHYVDHLFHLQRREVDQRFIDNTRAVDIANAEINRRLNSMNEIREQLNSQANTFASKDLLEAMRDRVSRLESNQVRIYAYIAGIVAAATIFNFFGRYFFVR